jgi:hypothetical protein
MTTRRLKAFFAIAAFVAFASAQVSFQLAFAAPASSTFASLPPQGVLAKVTTKDGSPIFINGVSSPSGSSVLTNTTIDTAGTAATLDLGPLGYIDLHPGAKIKIEFECPPEHMANPDPEHCKVKTTVLAGCITVHHKKGSDHEVVLENQQKVAGSDDDDEKKAGGTFSFCKEGVLPGVIGTGGLGLGWPAIGALIATAVIVPLSLPLIFDDGGNPTESALG